MITKPQQPLTKEQVDALTKAWFEIKNAPSGEVQLPGSTLVKALDNLSKDLSKYTKPDGTKGIKMSDVTKRKEFDKLYNAATDQVFNNVGTVKGYDGVKNYMHTGWLKLGFEAGDGNNGAVNLAYDLIHRSPDAPADKIVPYVIENYNAIDDYIGVDNKVAEMLRNFLVKRTDLWKSYSADDITKIIVQLHKLLKSKKNDAQREKILNSKDLENNLRNVLSMKAKDVKDSTVKVNKVTSKTSDDAIKQNLKSMGLDLDNIEDKKRLQNILNK